MPEIVMLSNDILGESPSWFNGRSSVCWVDIPRGIIHLLDPVSMDSRDFHLGGYVSSIVPSADNNGVVTSGKGVFLLNMTTGEISLLGEVSPWDSRNRFNDAKCDSTGRLWAGTMNLEKNLPTGSLYVFTPYCSFIKVLDRLTISNGITWNEHRNELYHIDTPTRIVSVYNYSKSDTSLILKRSLDLTNQKGRPDGMTIDSKGFLWIAMFNGGQVIKCDPDTGEVVDRIELPTKWITSCCFGNSGMRTLYITTASDPAGKSTNDRYAGNLYEERLNVSGLESYKFEG